MMTIEEAIKHCDNIVSSQCNECGEEHKQLAEWLKELKCLRKVVDKKYLEGISYLKKCYPSTWDRQFEIELRSDMTGMFRRHFSNAEMAEVLKGVDPTQL